MWNSSLTLINETLPRVTMLVKVPYHKLKFIGTHPTTGINGSADGPICHLWNQILHQINIFPNTIGEHSTTTRKDELFTFFYQPMLIRFLFINPIIRDIPEARSKLAKINVYEWIQQQNIDKQRYRTLVLPVPTFIFALRPSYWHFIAIWWGDQAFLPFKSRRAMAFHESKSMKTILLPSLQ